MRTLSTPCGRLLVIPGETLPEDAENIRVIQITGPAVLYYEFGNSKWTTITIPPGSWSLFGKASELTDRPCDYEANGIKENDILLIENKTQ